MTLIQYSTMTILLIIKPPRPRRQTSNYSVMNNLKYGKDDQARAKHLKILQYLKIRPSKHVLIRWL